jgi:nickel-dependent lactate racemase
MKRIEKAGVSDDRIVLIMAPGTHRPMTEQELAVKLGAGIMRRYTFLNRDYQDTRKFQYLGETESGTPIEVDREVLEADFVIGLGNITPHISAGWSGGAKIILPGICSARTTDMMHYAACVVQPVLEILGTCDNTPRQEMEEIAGKVGLSFIVNTVLDADQRIRGVFSGHYIEAHRKGTEKAEELQVIPIPQQADMLVVSANPCHFDYWQGIKPYAYGHRAVRDGGVMILMLDGTEGLCGDAPSHDPTLRKYMSWSFEDLTREVKEGRATDIVGMNVPMYHATLAYRTVNFIVTNHMSDRDIAVLGFERRDSVQDALNRGFALLGDDAKVGIIPFGGETLTRVGKEIPG